MLLVMKNITKAGQIGRNARIVMRIVMKNITVEVEAGESAESLRTNPSYAEVFQPLGGSIGSVASLFLQIQACFSHA